MLTDKLNIILSLLDNSMQEFELTEKTVEDEDLKKLILQLVQQSTQCADQLEANLHKIGKISLSWQRISLSDNSDDRNDNDILEKCSRNESILEKAYLEAMNCETIHEKLRNVMKDQLNEIKCILMKLRIKYLINNDMVYPHSLRRKTLDQQEKNGEESLMF